MVDNNGKTELSKREKNRQRQIKIEREQGLLRIDDALEKLPFGHDTWRAGAESGRFPKGKKGVSNAHLWKQSDVETIRDHGLMYGWDVSNWEEIKQKMAVTTNVATENQNDRPFLNLGAIYDCGYYEDENNKFFFGDSYNCDREIPTMEYKCPLPVELFMGFSYEKNILS